MGDKNTDNVLVFQGLRYSRFRTFITYWLTAAGITKNTIFHSFRHTFAVLQLELGTDIYTVSKMLGHKAFKNTEIYAKIVDKTKRKAADKVMLKLYFLDIIISIMKTKKVIVFPRHQKIWDQLGEHIKLARKRRKLTAIQQSEI